MKEVHHNKCFTNVREIYEHLKAFEITYVPMEQNCQADFLSKPANTKKLGHGHTIIQETLFALNLR